MTCFTVALFVHLKLQMEFNFNLSQSQIHLKKKIINSTTWEHDNFLNLTLH